MLSKIKLYFFWKYVNKVRRSPLSKAKRQIRLLEKLDKAQSRIVELQDTLISDLKEQIDNYTKKPTVVYNNQVGDEWEVGVSYE